LTSVTTRVDDLIRMPERSPVARSRARQSRTAAGAARTPPTLAAQVVALQRTLGNRGMRRVLARDQGATKEAPAGKQSPAATQTFRLLIADEGKHGLSDSIVKAALPIIQAELGRITKDSPEDAVKAGFDVQYVKTAPERNDDFTRSLGRNTFLIFLTSGKDPKHAIESMRQYIPLDKEEQKLFEQKFKNSLRSEGGVDLGFEPNARRRTSQSIGFVSTQVPLKELEKSGAGPASASAVLADVILHELGHAVGHNVSLASMDHDATGIMTAQLVLGSSGAHQSQKFSTGSARIIRDRLEELAKKLAPKRP
jgi:hypothetical protein